MSKNTLLAFFGMGLWLAASQAQAQFYQQPVPQGDIELTSAWDPDGAVESAHGCCDSVCNDCCDPCNSCCSCGGWVATAELLFMRYHRSTGVYAGIPAGGAPNVEDVEFDFEITPRVTVGYVDETGLGIRARWWSFDHAAQGTGAVLPVVAVDTWTFDAEVFDTIQLTGDMTIELSGGLRYVDFAERQFNFVGPLSHTSGTWGGLVGIEAIRSVSDNLALYGRLRGAILMGDAGVRGAGVPAFDTRLDVTQYILEIATGVEYNQRMDDGSIMFVRAGGEWQNWANYTTGRDIANFTQNADAGFGGITFAVGIAR